MFNFDLSDKPALVVEGSRVRMLEEAVEAEGAVYENSLKQEEEPGRGHEGREIFLLFTSKHLVPHLAPMRRSINTWLPE